MEPDFQEKFLAAPEETLAANGLHIDALSVKILCDTKTAIEYQQRPPEELPRVVQRYRGFLREKIAEHQAQIQKILDGVSDLLRANEQTESAPVTDEDVKELLKKYSRLH